ncbi:MAG: 2 protein, partial [Chloroflexota bacterium]|nr:2 protein [Chloroflexota bacterium]
MFEPSHDMTRPIRLRSRAAQARAWAGSPAGMRWLLALILLAGAYLRLSHVNWDEGTHIHPDERFLTMVTSALALPDSPQQFFDSTQSPMNPNNRGYDFFVYGTLPLFIVRVAAEVAQQFNASALLWEVAPGIPLNLTGYDGIHLVGRTLSGLFDVATLWLTFVIARRLFGRKEGTLAAALYAFAPLALQQSHFFTVDTFGTFFALLTFYFAVRVAQGGEAGQRGGGWGAYAALGAGLGASLACRINLAPLAAIAGLAALIRAWDDWHAVSPPGRAQNLWLSTLAQ